MPSTSERFTGRVNNYSTFRPSYPKEILDRIQSTCSLVPGSVVADIGSGTGIFARLLLEAGYSVIGVEPGDEMRAEAERLLAGYASFTSVAGTAEATPLDDSSVDLITAAQAFHWFDLVPTKSEFRRILRPGGSVALVWNERDVNSPFQKAYDALFRTHVPEYEHVVHTRFENDDLADFLDGGPVEYFAMPNRQQLDWDGLMGRMQSSSYSPRPGVAGFEPIVKALRSLFDEYEQDGAISFDYLSQLYLGHIA